MRLTNLSSLITEVQDVQGTVLQGRYPKHGKGPLEYRYWLLLGKFNQPTTGTPCIAVIDLKEAAHGVVGKPRSTNKKERESKPRYGMAGIQRIQANLPEILGYVSDKQITAKPTANIDVIKKVLSKYGEEGLEELGDIAADPEKIWKHREILPSQLTQDILNYFEKIGMEPRPLKSTTATDGRYMMGLKGIKDPVINGIFRYYYKTPEIAKISGTPIMTVLKSIEKKSDRAQSEELLRIAQTQIEGILKELEAEPPMPEKPEEMEPGEDLPVATAEKPLTPEPKIEPEVIAPKEVRPEGEPEPTPGIKAPAEKPILKSPGLQRKPMAKPEVQAVTKGIPEPEVSLEPEIEPSAEPPVQPKSPEQKEIEATAKKNIKGDLKKPAPKPILKAPPPPDEEPEI